MHSFEAIFITSHDPESFGSLYLKEAENPSSHPFKDEIKREGLSQDFHKGVLRMVDSDMMFKALRMAWIPRPLTPGNSNDWKTIPDYHLKGVRDVNFLLTCDYDKKHLTSLLVFYENILKYFRELKIMYNHNQDQNIILHNNKDILVGNRDMIPFIFYLTKLNK